MPDMFVLHNSDIQRGLAVSLAHAACPLPKLSDDDWRVLSRLFADCENVAALAVLDWAFCVRRQLDQFDATHAGGAQQGDDT